MTSQKLEQERNHIGVHDASSVGSLTTHSEESDVPHRREQSCKAQIAKKLSSVPTAKELKSVVDRGSLGRGQTAKNDHGSLQHALMNFMAQSARASTKTT